MVSKEKGQLEPRVRTWQGCMECQGWSRRPGQSGDRGMVTGQAGGTQFPILPPSSILHLPTACSPSPPVWSGWLWHSWQPSLGCASLPVSAHTRSRALL